MTRRIVAAVLLVVASAVALANAQVRHLPDAPGRWKVWQFVAYPDDRRLAAATAAEVRAVDAHLVALNATLRRTPGFDAPVGFSVETVGSLDVESHRPGQPPAAALPLPSTLNFGAYAVHEYDQGGVTRRDDTGETAQLLFFVNQLGLGLLFEPGGVPEFDALDTDVTMLPQSQPDVFGMPRHGDALVLKKSSAPLSTPVSLEECLQLLAAAAKGRVTSAREAHGRVQKQYDEARDPARRADRLAEFTQLAPKVKDPAYLDKMVKADATIEAELAKIVGPDGPTARHLAEVDRELAAVHAVLTALPSADRAAAACYAAGNPAGPGKFTKDLAPGCLPVVRPNWKLFNRALPRSAPQLLVIGHAVRCLGIAPQPPSNRGGCAANRQLLEGLDQRAVLAWLQ